MKGILFIFRQVCSSDAVLLKYYDAGLIVTALFRENLDTDVRCEVLKVIARKNSIFWDVMPVAR